MGNGVGRQPLVELASRLRNRQTDISQAPARKGSRRGPAGDRLLVQLGKCRIGHALRDTARGGELRPGDGEQAVESLCRMVANLLVSLERDAAAVDRGRHAPVVNEGDVVKLQVQGGE